MTPPFSEEERFSSEDQPASPATAARVAEEPGGSSEGEAAYSEEGGHSIAEEAEQKSGADAQAEEVGGQADEDHETKLEHDLEELTAKAEKADEYLELAKRTRADFENYRKRAAREAAAAQERGVVKLARELLPAVDNLDRALEAVSVNGDANEELVSGIKLVHAEVIAALNRAGVELYSPAGERFDPTCHEAVAQQPVEGAEPGTVVEVYQRGARLGDSVIRPARVVVAG